MDIQSANAFVDGHFKGNVVKEQVDVDRRGEELKMNTINAANIEPTSPAASCPPSKVRRSASSCGHPFAMWSMPIPKRWCALLRSWSRWHRRRYAPRAALELELLPLA